MPLVHAGTVLELDRDPLLARYMSVSGADAYRRKFDRSWLRRWSNRRERALVAHALAAIGARGRMLDVPCGAGRMTDLVLARADRVTCTDVSPAMLGHARRALARRGRVDGIEFARASVAALPFEDGAFDFALCWRLLHHLTQPALRVRALSELRRVVARGLVASFADADTWKSRLRRLRRAERRAVAITRDDLAREAAEAGFVLHETVRLASPFSHLAGAVLTCP